MRYLPQNLRSQFLMLIVGVIFIPLTVMLLVVGLLLWLDVASPAGGKLSFASIQSVVSSIPAIMQGQALDENSIPENTGITIIDQKNGQVIFSKLNFRESNLQRYRSIDDLIADDQHDYFTTHIEKDGQQLQVVISFPQLFDPLAHDTQREIIGILIIVAPIAMMILVGFSLSLLIIKNVNDRIRLLVQASSEIATGNLNFELKPQGNDHIAQLTRAFNHMREQLKAEESKRSQLMMSISHDLKTPLASIDGYIDALREGFAEDEATRQRFLQIMKDKSAVLTQRIASLISFAKLTTTDARIHSQQLTLSDFIEDFIELHQPEASLQGFTIEARLRLKQEVVLAFDPELLFRALENIFSNAMKFSDTRKHIIISLLQTDQDIQLSFQNYGRGLHEDDLNKVFEPFYRVNSSRNTPGTGLGLTSAKYIIEAHDWRIYAVSVINEMTRFIISIPLRHVRASAVNP